MKYLIKYILIFAAGSGCGVLASHLFLKKKYEKKADDEITSMQRYFENLYMNDGKKEEAPEPEAAEPPKEYDTRPYSDIPKSSIDFKKLVRAESEKEDYTQYYVKNEHPEDDEYNYKRGEELTKAAANDKGPKMIRAEEFESEPNFGSEVLYYYVEDDTLATENDELIGADPNIDEVSEWIGDALTKYKFKTNHETTIYVRNQKRCMDYQIIKVFGAFSYEGG